jgi:hypothetical protein
VFFPKGERQYKTADKNIVFYVFIFTFLDRRREDKRF